MRLDPPIDVVPGAPMVITSAGPHPAADYNYKGLRTVRLPEEWKADEIPTHDILGEDLEEDDNPLCASISGKSGCGTLQMTGAQLTSGAATDEHLRSFARFHFQDISGLKPLSCGAFSGFYVESLENTMHYRHWWLRSHGAIIEAIYFCAEANKGKDDAIVDGILASLKSISA